MTITAAAGRLTRSGGGGHGQEVAATAGGLWWARPWWLGDHGSYGGRGPRDAAAATATAAAADAPAVAEVATAKALLRLLMACGGQAVGVRRP